MRILLIEDSKRLQRSISLGLRESGYKVDTTGDGQEGLWFIESYEYDVVILDLMLPGLDGLSILKEVRKKENPVHILILSAKDTVEDKIYGLKAGADDYLVKPFAFEELLARIQALIRRRFGVKSNTVPAGYIEIDLDKRVVMRRGEVIDLTPREYSLLEFMTLNKGKVVSRATIEEHIYDERIELLSNVVDATICSVRKKIEIPEMEAIIKTRRGHGYIIEK
jgi:DNA-binding response OmpR family regulator